MNRRGSSAMRCMLSCQCYSVQMILDLCISKRRPYLRCTLIRRMLLLTETTKDDENLHGLGFGHAYLVS
jgi:hypothetical protein